MNNYYITAIVLDNCVYSNNLVKLLNTCKFNHKIITVYNNNKHLYKTNQIQLFPQIYLNKYNSKGNLLLGGYTEFKNIYDKLKNNKLDINYNEYLINKYGWSKKIILRLYQLINT